MTIWSLRVALPVLVLVLVAFGGTALRAIRWKRIRLTDFFVLAIGVFNGVGYTFVLWATEEGLNSALWALWIYKLRGFEWIYPTLSIIAILGVWFGEGATHVLQLRRASGRKSTAVTRCAVLNLPKWLPWTFLVLGVLTYWLYARPYGGFAGLLAYSGLIRAGRLNDIGISNPLSFLQRFGGLGMFSTLMFAGRVLSAKSRQARILEWIGFGAAGSFSVYVLVSWQGRLALILFFAAILLGVWTYRRGLKPRSVILALALTLSATIATVPLVTSLLTPGKRALSTIELFAREISFPAVSFSAALETPGIRGMQDLALWSLFFLPERVWKTTWGFDTASTYVTRLIMGAPKGEAGVTGAVPVDFVTFGFLQAGVIGVAWWSFIWGLALGGLDRWLVGPRLAGVWSFLYAYAGLFVAAMTALYSDPEHIIERNLHFIIGCVVIMLLKAIGNPQKRRL